MSAPEVPHDAPSIVFDDRVAENYDVAAAEMFEPSRLDPAVEFLAALAGSGPVLEFGIGTGRVAIPLVERGLGVSGIDVSAPMIGQLRKKPAASNIEAVVGSCATTILPGAFGLVYCVWNTFVNLLSQGEQVACFENAARHLSPGGHFVIEAGSPSIQGLLPGERYKAFTVSATRLGFDEIDTMTQRGISHHYWVVDDRLESWSAPWRYVWPSELDLMGRIAGLQLVERWSGWKREPFVAPTDSLVSVWRKPLGDRT